MADVLLVAYVVSGRRLEYQVFDYHSVRILSIDSMVDVPATSPVSWIPEFHRDQCDCEKQLQCVGQLKGISTHFA